MKKNNFKKGLIFSIVLSMLIPAQVFALDNLTFKSINNELPIIIDGHKLQSPWGYGKPSASYPALLDIDIDGDLDLFIGTGEGTIMFYRNEGDASSPVFILEEEKFLGINKDQYVLFPTFADADQDGDKDLYFGEYTGGLSFYESRSDESFTYANGSEATVNVKNFAAPNFADIDNDGDLDLFVGNFDGVIHYYENVSDDHNPQFILTDNNYNEIEYNEVAIPRMLDIDNDEDFDLIVASDNKKIDLYKNIGNPRIPKYNSLVTTLLTVDSDEEELYIYPAFGDIDNDGDLDVFVGTSDGSLLYYENNGDAESYSYTLVTPEFFHLDVGDYSQMQFVDIDDDSINDLFVMEGSKGVVNLYKNINTQANPQYTYQGKDIIKLPENAHSFNFTDIDNDKDFDLIIGYYDRLNKTDGGTIDLYRNIGTVRTPKFHLEEGFFDGIDVGEASNPELVDFDGDEDYDLFIGSEAGPVFYYQNTGDKTNPMFTLESKDFNSLGAKANSHIKFADMDNDGDLDIILGEKYGQVTFYENITGNRGIDFIKRNEILDVGGYSTAETYDINSDGKMDLFLGSANGSIHHLEQTSDTLFPPEDITDLKIEVLTESIIDISWNESLDSENDLKEYRVYQRIDENNYLGSSSVNKLTTVRIVDLLPDHTYTFKIVTVDYSELESEGIEIAIKIFNDGSNEITKIAKIINPTDPNEPKTEFCGSFNDVEKSTISGKQCDAIDFVKERGIFTGNENGALALNKPINRAEVTKVLVEAFNLTSNKTETEHGFTDIPKGEWYEPYVITAKSEGIIKGYADKTFKPGQTINKVELLKIVLELANADFSTIDIGTSLYEDIEVTPENEWFIQYTNYTHVNDLLETRGNLLNPDEAMSRADVIYLLYNLKQKEIAFQD